MHYEQTLQSNPAEVTRDLRDVFTPLCTATAEAALPENVTANDPEIREKVDEAPVHTLPTDYELGAIPWDLLLDKDLKGLDEAKAARRADPLENYNDVASIKNDIQQSWLERHPEVVDRVEILDLERKIDIVTGDRPSTFDMDKYKKYEQYIAALSESERGHIEGLQRSRTHNVGKWEWATAEMKQVGTMLHAHNETLGTDSALLSELVMPVGEYGESFARELLKTTATMQGVAEKHTRGLAEEMTAGNEPVLTDYTARGADLDEANSDSTMNSLQEGILSIGQSLAILTMEKVEGYDDPHELVRDIVKAGLIGRLARYSPMGFVGPMALSGHYIPGSLVRTEKGLAFSVTFEGYLKEKKTEYIGRLAASDMQSHGKHAQPLGKICPVANVGGGVDAMANTYADLMEAK